MQWYIGHTIWYVTPPQPSSDDDVSWFICYILFFFINYKLTHYFSSVWHIRASTTTPPQLSLGLFFRCWSTPSQLSLWVFFYCSTTWLWSTKCHVRIYGLSSKYVIATSIPGPHHFHRFCITRKYVLCPIKHVWDFHHDTIISIPWIITHALLSTDHASWRVW